VTTAHLPTTSKRKRQNILKRLVIKCIFEMKALVIYVLYNFTKKEIYILFMQREETEHEEACHDEVHLPYAECVK
jgi:hypothetical protein